MKFVALVALLLPLVACAGGPQSLGITGPDGGKPASSVTRTPEPQIDPFDNPSTLQSGGRYGPNAEPTTDGGRFWGYN